MSSDNKLEIHWWGLPDNTFLSLPEKYRTLIFQLCALEFENYDKLISFLKERELTTNVIRWKLGNDEFYKQLINKKVLLYLEPYVVKRIEILKDKYFNITKKLNFQNNRVPKDVELMNFIKEIKYLFGGNKNFSDIIKVNVGAFYSYIYKSKTNTMPVNVLKNILNFLEENLFCYSFSLEEIEEQIISYRVAHGKEIFPEYLNERKLPIKITPEFDSILFHLFGDGYVNKIGSGEYTQLNEISKNNFLVKLYTTFGYFHLSNNGFNQGRVFIPRTIIEIIKNYYNLDTKDFLGWNSKLPEIIFSRPNSFKLAGAVSFIVDEAHVAKSNIILHSSNVLLLSQIRILLIENGINCSTIKIKKGNGSTKESYRFSILKESIYDLVMKVNELKTIYPTCNLSQKEKKIMKILSKEL